MSCLDDLNDFYDFYGFYDSPFTVYRLPFTTYDLNDFYGFYDLTNFPIL